MYKTILLDPGTNFYIHSSQQCKSVPSSAAVSAQNSVVLSKASFHGSRASGLQVQELQLDTVIRLPRGAVTAAPQP
eukprot:5127640-Amphidinium_carterae.1